MSNISRMKEFISNFDDNSIRKKRMIIDCGHMPISYDSEGFHHSNIEPSKAEISTLETGLILGQHLIDSGFSDVNLNICLSDTGKYIKDVSSRSILRDLITERCFDRILPKSYCDLLLDYSFLEKAFITLQSKNSNSFMNQLKKAKKRIKTGDNEYNSFNQSNSIYLVSNDDNIFGFSNPFLLNCQDENKTMRGEWWLNESIEINSSDLVKSPLLRVKKMKVINVYSKSSGILCPGSYCGLLQNYDNNCNHISIYSREDDPFIGEKVSRGIISAFSLVDSFDRKCFQFTLSKIAGKVECSVVDKNTFVGTETSTDFLKSFQASNLSNTYRIYS
jgi:hypothetical protein